MTSYFENNQNPFGKTEAFELFKKEGNTLINSNRTQPNKTRQQPEKHSAVTPNTIFSVQRPDFFVENIEAEESLLGCILMDPNTIDRVHADLPIEAFFVKAHRLIYAAALELRELEQPVDLMTVTTRLRDKKMLDQAGGTLKLAQLVERTVSSVNADRYAALLIDKYVRRQVIALSYDLGYYAYEFQDNSTTEFLEQIEEKVKTVVNSQYRYGSSEEFKYRQYRKIIDEVRKLELGISKPGFRAFMFYELAAKYKMNPKKLEDIYFKSLVDNENEPAMTLQEAIDKYGGQVREWFLHGFLPKGSTVLLHALGGVGKTRLAYNFMYHLMTGQNWEGFPVTAPQRRCLLVQTDESPSDMLVTLEERGIQSNMPIRLKTRWTVDHIQYLKREIEEFGAELVIIDSLTSISRHSLFSENATEYARPVLMLRDIAQELGCTIVIIHHQNSQGTSRGTKAIFNSVSEVYSLKRDPEFNTPTAPERVLSIEKSRSRRSGSYKLRFNREDGSLSCWGKEGEEDNSPAIKTKDLIVQLLADHPNTPLEAIEVHNQIGGSERHIRRCLFELAQDGLISRKRKWANKAYQYFLSVEHLVQLDQPDSTVTSHDFKHVRPAGNPCRASDSGLAGPDDNENNIFSDGFSAQKSEVFGGQRPAKRDKPISNKGLLGGHSVEHDGNFNGHSAVLGGHRAETYIENLANGATSNVNPQNCINGFGSVNSNGGSATSNFFEGEKLKVGDRVAHVDEQKYPDLKDGLVLGLNVGGALVQWYSLKMKKTELNYHKFNELRLVKRN